MKRLKILFVTTNYAPDLIGIPKYNTELAEWLAEQGHEVHVITTAPYYPEWKVKDGYQNWKWSREVINSVGVTRVPAWIPKNPKGLVRIAHLSSFGFTSFLSSCYQALAFKPDIVVGIEPTLFAAPSVLAVKLLSKAKAWLHVQDFELAAALATGLVKKGRASLFALAADRWVKKKFDFLSSISTNMVARLSATVRSETRTELIPNWVDCAQIFPVVKNNAFRAALPVSETDVVALYSGNMGNKQGLRIIMEAARLTEHKTPELKYVLCGTGSAKANLLELSKGLTNVFFMPLQPLEKLNELLSSADIHLLPQLAAAADLVLPSKLTGMLASGRPVLACAKHSTALYDEVKGRGICVEPENVTAFIEALEMLANSPLERAGLGAEGRSRALSHWDKEAIMVDLEISLYRMVSES